MTQRKIPVRKFSLYFGLPWILFGALLVLLGVNEWKTNKRYEEGARQVEAKVLSKRSETRRASGENQTETYYYVRYSFTPPKGQAIENESSLSKEEWNHLSEGGPVAVEYLFEDPATNRLVSANRDLGPYLMFGFGALLCMVGITFIGRYFGKRRRSSRMKSEGLKAQGTISTIRKSSLSINDVPQMIIYYSFKDRLGREFSGESDYVAPNLVRDLNSGAPCTVLYDKDNPAESMLESF